MPTSLEFEDKLVENAVEKACRELNISKEKLKYDVISYGSSGIFGLVGTKKARIRVTLPDAHKYRPKAGEGSGIGAREEERIAQEEIRETVSSLVEEAFEGTPSQDEPFEAAVENGFSQVSDKESSPESVQSPDSDSALDSALDSGQEPEKVSEPASPEKPEPERRSKSSGKSRRKSSRSKRKSNKGETDPEDLQEKSGQEPLPSSEPHPDLTEIPAEPSGRESRNIPEDVGPGTDLERCREGLTETEPIDSDSREESGEDITGPAIDKGESVLQRVIDFITTGATIDVKREKERVLYQVNGGETGVLIGRRGQTLEAIQYLVEKIVNKHASERIRVQVDIEGYLDGRKNRLKNLANRLSEKAKRTGKPVTIGQLNSHDRRIVHLSLKEDNGVRTQSMGDGFYRKLVIFPKKKSSGQKKK